MGDNGVSHVAPPSLVYWFLLAFTNIILGCFGGQLLMIADYLKIGSGQFEAIPIMYSTITPIIIWNRAHLTLIWCESEFCHGNLKFCDLVGDGMMDNDDKQSQKYRC